MKRLIWGLMAVSGSFSKAKDLNLELVRQNFAKAATDKEICREMLVELRPENQNSLSLAYLGGFQAIWANHVLNPVTKMETFCKGKANIEQAVKEDPASVEIRFIRLSIQENCPWFIRYHQQEQEDRSFLVANRTRINSPSLRKLIDIVLKDQK